MVRSLIVLVALAACSRASDEGDAKKWSAGAPPREVEIPASLSIAVAVDGSAKPPITADTLRSIKPDFTDAEHKVWLIASLVVDAAPAGSVVEAGAPTGVSLKLAHPMADGLEPVLFLTRRGEVIVSTIDPKDPFPKYHGQGGRMHRAGDSSPRVGPVNKISITHSK